MVVSVSIYFWHVCPVSLYDVCLVVSNKVVQKMSIINHWLCHDRVRGSKRMQTTPNPPLKPRFQYSKIGALKKKRYRGQNPSLGIPHQNVAINHRKEMKGSYDTFESMHSFLFITLHVLSLCMLGYELTSVHGCENIEFFPSHVPDSIVKPTTNRNVR
jgi:hypothetical protein